MFFRISFNVWHNQAMKKERKAHEEREIALHGPKAGKKFKEDDENEGYETVEIELPPIEVEYTSEEEELTFSAPKNRNSRSGLNTGESAGNLDDSQSMIKEKTPNAHRRRVKFQKMAASRRFTSTY